MSNLVSLRKFIDNDNKEQDLKELTVLIDLIDRASTIKREYKDSKKSKKQVK